MSEEKLLDLYALDPCCRSKGSCRFRALLYPRRRGRRSETFEWKHETELLHLQDLKDYSRQIHSVQRLSCS
jgi:hypothetical protein